jgi:hypothetical protein
MALGFFKKKDKQPLPEGSKDLSDLPPEPPKFDIKTEETKEEIKTTPIISNQDIIFEPETQITKKTEVVLIFPVEEDSLGKLISDIKEFREYLEEHYGVKPIIQIEP